MIWGYNESIDWLIRQPLSLKPEDCALCGKTLLGGDGIRWGCNYRVCDEKCYITYQIECDKLWGESHKDPKRILQSKEAMDTPSY